MRGHRTYFTNYTCPECGLEFKSNKLNIIFCSLSCQDRASKKRNKKTRQDYGRRYAKKNREYFRLKGREWYKKNPERARFHATRAFFKKRGIKLEATTFCDLLEKQKGVCAICKKMPTKRLFIDHCHKNKKIRGLLCTNCNTVLGMAKDDVVVLKSAVRYLGYYDRAWKFK